MTEPSEGVSLRVVALLVIVALASVATLWSLDPTSPASQSTFATFLAVDLVAFAMISYIYRGSKGGEKLGRWPLLAGCVFITALLFIGFLA